jgi:hypothetical protein
MYTSDMTLEDAELLSFRRSILKKFKGVTHPEAKQRAIAGFIADNERCRSFKITPKTWFDEYLLGEVKLLLEKWLHDSDGCPATLVDLTNLGKCGPGSSVDVDIPAFFTKLFDSTLSTANPDLRRLYSAIVFGNPKWLAAEEWREFIHGNRTVPGSTLSTVLKQFDIDRTICTEPPLEMFFQLGIGGYLEYDVLAPLGINLATQPDKNRWLAKRGSLDGEICTLDLRSASNSISLALLELMPRYFAVWLRRCRSPKAKLPGGSWLDLHMVASMGNGYCFPLQTMLFASVVCAVYRLLGIEPNFGSAKESRFSDPLYGYTDINAGVFGDDIAVRREAYHLVIRALELLGFQVNHDKSFSTGDFRESCGHDYFRGVNIRGVYLKTLTNRSDCYSAINRLIRWSTRSGIPCDFTVAYLLSTIGFSPIPYQEDDSGGVKVPFTWSGPEWYSLTGSHLYYIEAYSTEKLRVAHSADEEPGEVRGYRMGYNPDGIHISYLGGYIRGGYISLRGDMDDGMSSSCPEVLLREVPTWDYIPKAEAKFELRDHDWEVVVERVFALAFTRWQPLRK